MKPIDIIDISSLRQLLDRYYAGTTDASEEEALMNWFATHDDNDIPADLAADAEMMRSLSKARTEAFASEVISSIAGNQRRRSIRPAMWVGIAAALATIITLTGKWINVNTDSATDGNRQTPELLIAINEDPTVASSSSTPAEIADDIDVCEELQESSKATSTRKSRATRSGHERVVTDSTEAKERIDHAMSLLADNLHLCSQKARKADETLKETSQTIKSTLYETNS